ncbi:GAF domain-containing protein [Sorangium sp. So ce362]|uniref:GAF domain-containing protein n=1 Tax=Sorangium sp. So ce362 TaxID=3133303 RepID=UPI003F5E6634
MGTSAHPRPPSGPSISVDSTDIEALKREIERLRVVASRDRGWLDAVLEHSPHGVILCDASGKLVLHNRAAERIWAGSASTESIQDWTLYRAFHEDGRPYEAGDWAMARAMAARQVIESEETRIQRFDGTRGMVLGSAAPLIGPGGELEGGISVFADVSRLKQVEAERGELAAQLTRRVEELDRSARLTQALLAVSSALSGAVTVEQMSTAVLRDIHRVLNASTTMMYAADEAAGVATLIGQCGLEAQRATPYVTVPLDARLPLSEALRERRPIWVGTKSRLHAGYPELAALRPARDDIEALAVLPIITHGALLGGLSFSFATERAWTDEEREFLLSVAAQCASALDRARLLEQEREARARAEMLAAELERQQATLRLLSEAGAVLSNSLDDEARLTHLTHLAVPTLADWCAVDMLNGDTIERVAVHHGDPAKIELGERLRAMSPPRPDAATGVPAVIRTGRPEWVADIPGSVLESAAQDPEHLRLIRSLGLRSYVVVPLRGRERTIGALTLVHAESGRRFSEADVALAEELANRVALLIDNARLFQQVDASRQQLAGLFNQAPAGICILRGPRHVFELVNPTYHDILGGREVMGRPIREALPDLEGQGIFELLDRVYRSGQPYVGTSVPLRLRRGAAGMEEERFFNFVYQAMRAQGGSTEGVMAFAFEVTDQVLARRHVEHLAIELSTSEARLRTLVQATTAIVWTTTPEGKIIESSPSWREFTGQDDAEYLRGAFMEVIHPEDREATARAWSDATARGAVYEAEYRLRRRDGTYAYTVARAAPVRATDGSIREYVGCNMDISLQREAERLTREHAEVLETLHEVGQALSAELELDALVQSVIDAGTKLSGAAFGAFFYNVNDAQGVRSVLYAASGAPKEVLSRFPMPRSTAVFAPAFSVDGVIRLDDVTRDPRYGTDPSSQGPPEGHLAVTSYLAVPVVSRSGKVIGGMLFGHPRPGVFTERSERVTVGLAAQAAVAMDNARLFREAQSLIRALERTNAELDQFAYVTSHDLKAPLRGIASLAQWIEEDLSDRLTAETRHQMEMLRGRVRRMEALIEGILAYSRATRFREKPESVDLEKLAREVVELIAPRPPARVTLDVPPAILKTYRVPLQQVLMNLITNGLKHAGRDDATVFISAREQGDRYEIAVSDNGTGIAPAFQEKVWGMFQTLQARDKVESTGIGLAIVRKIVESRGGRAWVESDGKNGATFRFTWPKREEAQGAA